MDIADTSERAEDSPRTSAPGSPGIGGGADEAGVMAVELQERPLSMSSFRNEDFGLLDGRGQLPVDNPIVTQKELRAWYMYDWANSVYSSVAIVLFIPLLLVNLAKREVGCPVGDDEDEDDECTETVQFGLLKLRPAAFAFTVISLSVLAQAVLFVSVGSLADHGANRRKMLGLFCVLGSVCTMAFVFMADPATWWFAGVLAILSNSFFGASIVFYNAYLPILTAKHPTVLDATSEELRDVEETVANQISTNGFVYGYVSGVLLTIVSVGIVVSVPDKQDLGVRLCLLMAGAWWLGFGMYSVAFLHTRPGPPLPAGVTNYVLYSWSEVIATLKDAARLPNTFRMLIAFFFYSDGYSTIASVGVLFGTEELGMGTTEVIILAIEAPLGAVVGNYFFLWLQRRRGWRPKTMILVHLCLLSLIPLYGCLGFFAPFGITTAGELYAVVFFYGLNLGSIQSFSRTVYADLIPPSRESEFFSFFEVTDKGSSWIGPLVVGSVFQATGSMRVSLAYLLAFLVLPMIPVYFVDVDKGKREAIAFVSSKSKMRLRAEEAQVAGAL